MKNSWYVGLTLVAPTSLVGHLPPRFYLTLAGTGPAVL